jgi:hypothetical protein
LSLALHKLFLCLLGGAEDPEIKILSTSGGRIGDERVRAESSDGTQETSQGLLLLFYPINEPRHDKTNIMGLRPA